MPVTGSWTYATVSITECRIESYNTSGGYDVTIPTSLDGYSVIEIYNNALQSLSLTDVTINHAVELENECFADNSNISVTINSDLTTPGVGSTDPPFENCSIGGSLTITNNVTTIPQFLFYNAGLTSLSLPTSVTTVSDYAFSNNSISDLTLDFVLNLDSECFARNAGISVTLDEDLTTTGSGLGTSPFENCEIGNNLTITNNVTAIPSYIFNDSGLTSLSLPTSVTTVSDYAFSSNSIDQITLDFPIILKRECFARNSSISVTLDEDITVSGVVLGTSPFEGCNIDSLTITNNTTIIPNYLFASAGITNVSFPTSVSVIGNYSFYNNNLTALSLPTSITAVSQSAFESNSIENLTLNNAINLDDECFKGNSGISVTIDTNNIDTSNVLSKDYAPFENCNIDDNVTFTNNVITIPKYLFASAGVSSVSFPTSVTIIGDSSFYNNNLTAVSIPTSVTLISRSAFESNNIENLTLSNAISLDDECFKNNSGISVTLDSDSIDTSYVLNQEYGPFENCDIDDNLTITSNVTIVPSYLFAKSGISSVTFPTSVTEIGKFAFYGNNLTALSLPTSVAVLSESAFESNSISQLSLSHEIKLDDECFARNSGISVTINANVDTSYVTSYLSAPFESCGIGNNLTFTNNTTVIPENLFASADLTSVTVVEAITTISDSAFRANTDLAYFLVLNDNVSFGSNILDGCMSVDNKGNIYGGTVSNTKDWWEANYTSTYNFNETFKLFGIGQYVKIYLNSDLKFTGTVDNSTYKKESEAVATIFQNVNCTNLNNIPARRTIKLDYDSDTTASTIVNDMIDDYLALDGIEAGEIQNGVVFENEWKNEVINIGEVLDECANRSGYQWYIDKDMKLNFVQNPTTISSCTYTLEDSGSFEDFRAITVDDYKDNYANKIFVMGGNDDHGDLIYTINGSLTEQNRIQEINCGTGIHNYLFRDSGIVEHDYKVIESGSSPTQINFTAHPMSTGDFFWNITRNAYSFVTSISTDSFICESVASQASGDEIEYYVDCNKIGKNEQQKRVTVPQVITFKSFSNEFEPGTKLTVSISDMSLSGTYNIDSVNIEDVGSCHFVSTVKAIKRVSESDFSTQKNSGYKEFFRDY